MSQTVSQESTYNPLAIEKKWYSTWEQSGYFKPSGKGTPFTIMLPPPNVTGSLHMGHGFNNAIMDTLTRYKRMSGCNTLWQPGTDHAGIATQMVVERQLDAQGLSRHELGREQFLSKVWQWKEQSGGTITGQLRRLGSSVDWSRERFTMDAGLSNAVKEVFVRLHEQGLIYRGKRLVNWDPKLHTALSDLEVENTEEAGSLWHFKYYFADAAAKTSMGDNYVVVATTRPETLLGDTAVAVHPDDERYKHLIGQQVVLPISGRLVPVVADEYVEKDFGTGVVKITPGHDFNDYEVGKRQQLPIINILSKSASILAEFEQMSVAGGGVTGHIAAPERYAGLDRYAARKQLVQEAEAEGWLDKIEPYTLKAPRGDRSGVVVEPLLTDQWYVSIASLAKPAIDAVADGRIKFVPEQYSNMYMAWMNNIQDWCISRQLWWGHRIPAWYDSDGNVYVGRDEAAVRAAHNLAATVALQQDEDVLDTWFSSALWTFSTLGWPEQTDELKTFHSTDVLVTGFDIIFFWVARMIMLTMHFVKNKDGTPQVPFKTVYVHGLVRDGEGQKMSKSKGNVLDPIDIIDGVDLETLVAKRTTGLMNPKAAEKIEKATRKEFPEGISSFGTDAMRFTFCALANTGRDIKFDMKRVEGYRNFCNKIWNATRFVLMNVEGKPIASVANPALWQLPEQWIVSRLQRTELLVAESLASYRLDLAAQAMYDFIWNEYCDWYVELCKASLQNTDGDPAYQAEVRRVLLAVLETVLRLIHPIMPFISEELWQTIAPMVGRKTTDSIMLASYPVCDAAKINPTAESNMQWLQELITGVRNIRGEMNLGPARLLPVLLQNMTVEEQARFATCQAAFMALAKVESVSILASGETAPMASSAMVGALVLLVPMKGLIDPTAEITRLQKELAKLQNFATALNNKLSNDAFVANAPPAVIDVERKKLADTTEQVTVIEAKIKELELL